MKIRMYSGGGPTYLPTANQIGAAGKAASADSETSSKVPGFTKELINLVKENGLDSDVVTFLKQVEHVLDLANDPTGENINMRQILKAQRLASRVATNYTDYKEAVKALDKENNWGEVATNRRGQLYVKNQETGGLDTISYKDYQDNPDKYIALTNEELLEWRRNDPTLAYKTDIIDDVGSAIGVETIVKWVSDRIKDFGKTTITGYSEKQAAKIKSGLEHIISGDAGDFRGVLAAGPDGVYKISSESTIADTGIKQAMQYLYETLPKDFKRTLGGKAVVENYSPEALLLQMLMYNTDRQLKADYEKDASEAAGHVTKTSEKDAKDTYLMRVATGGTYTPTIIMPNPDNPSQTSAMFAMASNVGDLIDKNGKRLEIGNLNSVFEKLLALEATQSKDVTFGNQLLKDGQAGAIIWDGVSQLTDVWLPYTNTGGRIKPNLELLQNFNLFNEKLAENPNITQLEKNSLMQSFGIDPNIVEPDPQNKGLYKIKQSAMMKFLSFSGIVSDDNIDLTDSTLHFSQKLDKDSAKIYKDLYNNAVKYNTIARSKSTKAVNTAFNSAKKNDLYKGNIFIPITDMYLSMHMSKDQKLNPALLRDFAGETQVTKQLAGEPSGKFAGIGQF